MSGVASLCNSVGVTCFRLDEAFKALKSEIDFYSQTDNHGMLNKLVMGLVLIQLHRGDSVAADQAFRNCLG